MAHVEDRQAAQQIGDELRAGREEMGYSLEEAQELTNIHVRYLEALERDDFDALPNRAWARGFIVTYANRLGLEGEKLAQKVFPVRRQPRPMRWATRHWRKLVVASGALFVGVAFVVTAVIVAPYNNFTEGVTDILDRFAPGLFLDSGTQRVAILGFTGEGAVGGDNVLAAKVGDDGSGLLSIPGNTVAEIPGHGQGQIGDAYALGGADLTRETVAQMTGAEVPYHLVIDAAGVRNVVDTMGGVKVNVARPVEDRLVSGGPVISLDQGPQVLDGTEALVYLQGSDLPDSARRSERQRDFLYAMFGQALAPGNLITDPTTLTTVLDYTDTNLSVPEALQLGSRLRDLEDSGMRVRSDVVPGRQDPGAGLKPDEKELRAVLDETLR